MLRDSITKEFASTNGANHSRRANSFVVHLPSEATVSDIHFRLQKNRKRTLSLGHENTLPDQSIYS